MPDRTTVVLPPRLKKQVTTRARQQGVSFSEFVRQTLRQAVNERAAKRPRTKDPFWSDVAVYEGAVPPDISVNHYKYLYDEES